MSLSKSLITRRDFIGTAAAAAALATGVDVAEAQTSVDSFNPPDIDQYDFLLPRVCNNNPDWDFGPGGEKILLQEMEKVLHVKVKLQPNVQGLAPSNGLPEHFNAVVDLTSVELMRKFPVIFMSGTGSYRLPKARCENIKSYLESGGFLLMDECAAPWLADDFYNSSYATLVSIFGADAIFRIPEDHEIYHTVYDTSQPTFNRWKHPEGNSGGNVGVKIGDRLAVFLCDADIHCGWLEPDGKIGRTNFKQGIQIGINIFAYALSH